MTYHKDGYLTVNENGIYYVYCQIYYYDGNNSYTGFNVYIDDRRIMKAINSVIGKDKPYQTHFTAGVFKINKGQRIWVGATITRSFYFNEDSAFFGAFLLHSS